MPKEKKSRATQQQRQEPLISQLSGDAEVKPRLKEREKAKRVKQREEEASDPEDEFLSEAISRRILDSARRQQEEVVEDKNSTAPQASGSRTSKQKIAADEDADNDEVNQTLEDEEEDDGAQWEEYEEMEVNPQDEAILAQFMGASKPAQRQTLGDIIAARIREKEEEMAGEGGGAGDEEMPMPKLPAKVLAVYQGVGKLLKTYKSGGMPKAFKIIPSLNNWEEILYVTQPLDWSPHAVYQATRLFASNLNARMAQRFYNLVLLPRVRDDIREHKKLHFYLYQALRKSLYKPAAFFRGILLPLCESGTCTLKEAAVLGSVMSKVSIPVLHSAVALMKIAEAEYSGGTSMFLRVLIDKKYSLPYSVLDSLFNHFMRFMDETRVLPVLWHQSLLSFVQRYKNDLSVDQKNALKQLLKVQQHHMITPEIKRELLSGNTAMSM